LTSRRFNELERRRIEGLSAVAARRGAARPLDKYRLVKLLQEMGEVVPSRATAPTTLPLSRKPTSSGDGHLRTEVAKEASKIVLLDDAFSTIGRRFIGADPFTRTFSGSCVSAHDQFERASDHVSGRLLFNVRAPFTVLQLLWNHVSWIRSPRFAALFGAAARGLMNRPAEAARRQHRDARDDEDDSAHGRVLVVVMSGCS